MTPNEITTLIATEKHKELDVPYKKIVYEWVKYWRSTLIKQSLDKVRQDARHFTQVIRMPMQPVNTMQQVAPIPLTALKSMTIANVPLALRVTDNGLFSYVGGIDGQSPFGYSDAGMLPFMQSGKYTSEDIYYEYLSRKIYVCDPNLPMIQINGVFNEPEEAMKWETGVYDHLLDWWDTDIPMSGDIEQRVIQCVLATEMASRDPQKPEDYQIPMNGENQ